MDATTTNTVRESILSFLAARVPRDLAARLDADTPLLASGVVDSIGIVELMLFLDERHAINLSDEDFEERNFATVATLADFVEARRAAA